MSKITESYEYQTSILTSYEGTEQRIKTRQKPRHLISYDYSAMNEFQAQWLRGIMRMRQTDIYRLPMWHNVTHLSEDFIGGKALKIEERSMYNFENCDAILIFNRDDHNQATNIVREVRVYNDGEIGLRHPIKTPLDKRNTWICPLKRCSIQPASDLSYVFHKGSEVTLNFEDILFKVNENKLLPRKYMEDYQKVEQFNKFNFPEKLDNKLVFPFSPQWTESDSVSLSVNKKAQKVDNTTGIFLYDLINNRSYDTHSMKLVLWNKEMINNMKKFFFRVSGMYKSFYCPSWVDDIEPCADIKAGIGAIYTTYNKMYKFYQNNNRTKKVIIFTKDFRVHISEITSYGYEDMNDGGKWGKILLRTPFEYDIPLNNILMISYLNLVRLDSDTLSISYETHETAEIDLVFREVDE